MSAPADLDASQQTTHTVSLVQGGGAGERVRWVGEREILVVVTQCLLLPIGTHHSYTTHTVPLPLVHYHCHDIHGVLGNWRIARYVIHCKSVLYCMEDDDVA